MRSKSIIENTTGNTVHNLLLVDFPCGKSSDTSNVGCFFSIISLIKSQQNHAQTRCVTFEK